MGDKWRLTRTVAANALDLPVDVGRGPSPSRIPEAHSMLRADSISVLNHSCRRKPLLGKTHVSAKSFSDLSISNDLRETNEKHVSTAALQGVSFLLYAFQCPRIACGNRAQ